MLRASNSCCISITASMRSSAGEALAVGSSNCKAIWATRISGNNRARTRSICGSDNAGPMRGDTLR